MPGGRDCFCFLLIGRRRILTRDPILSEPEVPLVGKFRFFRLEPSVIDSTVLETSSTNDVTIDAYIILLCALIKIYICESQTEETSFEY